MKFPVIVAIGCEPRSSQGGLPSVERRSSTSTALLIHQGTGSVACRHAEQLRANAFGNVGMGAQAVPGVGSGESAGAVRSGTAAGSSGLPKGPRNPYRSSTLNLQ